VDAAHFFRAGWIRFPLDSAVAEWTARARPIAEACVADPDHRARWLRCGGTWFIGVNVLPNDSTGAVAEAGVPSLAGAPIDFVAERLELPAIDWDRAQISVCFPGYPRPSPGEADSVFRFRRDRDAAHVDGLKRFDGRRWRLGEAHGFILGLPLTAAAPNAAPLVAWEGSHEVMRRALRGRLADLPAERWASEDLTEAYGAARRECFDTCRRVPIVAQPGEAYLIHRLTLHGIAPWTADSTGERAVAYFRPDPFPGAGRDWWLDRP
jgi:hypothetical protein